MNAIEEQSEETPPVLLVPPPVIVKKARGRPRKEVFIPTPVVGGPVGGLVTPVATGVVVLPVVVQPAIPPVAGVAPDALPSHPVAFTPRSVTRRRG